MGLWSSWKSKDYPSSSNSLKTWAAYNHRKQCPIKRDSLEELQPIIEKFITQRLLGPCQSPCNIPILPVLKPTGDHRLVQELRLVNEAVVPTYPCVVNSYTILTQIPDYTQWYTVSEAKDAFFCIPVHPDSQYLFACGGQTPKQ